MATTAQKQKLPPFALLLLVSFALLLLITYQTFRDRKSVADLMKVKDSAIEDLEESLRVNLSIFVQIIESSFLSFLFLHQILALPFLSFYLSVPVAEKLIRKMSREAFSLPSTATLSIE